MNQEKIGKFIQESRKKKKLTQAELAQKLGVTDRAVSNWENGKNMPDLALFKPLCDILDISINDLMSGEVVNKGDYQEKLEENIIKTLNYSSLKISEKSKFVATILLVVGLLITISALTIFPSDSSWGSIYSVLGCMIALIGVAKFTRKTTYAKRLLICFSFIIVYIGILFFVDYLSVVTIKQAPRFSYLKEYADDIIVYKAPFYNVYRINRDTPNEYYIIDTKKEYTEKTVPRTPFNRDNAGIDNIIKYKNKYVGNNSNDANLVNNLPLGDINHAIEIDSDNLGLTIDYFIADWYLANNEYLEASMVYNSVVIFYLIDNVEYVTYKFVGNEYTITREEITTKYPNYKDITTETFNKYVEQKMNDDTFVKNIYKELFE